jgi:antitoxin HicB
MSQIMSQKHRTYKQIKQEFSPERQTDISAGAQKIRKELKILSTIQQSAGLIQEELADYLHLNYPIVLHADPDGGYVAEIKDLPGCLSQGESIEETLKNINEARELWLETVFELGKSIPLPSD